METLGNDPDFSHFVVTWEVNASKAVSENARTQEAVKIWGLDLPIISASVFVRNTTAAGNT